MRPRLDTSTAEEFVTTDSSIWAGDNYEIHRSPARMIETLKQGGMIIVLVLLSEGFFVLGGALGNGGVRETRPTATTGFFAGAILCSSALILLYSLGTRDEK